jgi:prepilin peptidase CpaA
MLKEAVLPLAGLLAVLAGLTDWRWRRIPNWLTVPGVVLGITANSLAWGRAGAKSSLEGLGLGLLLLLPLVVVRGIGAGDWKLVGAIGACLGPHELLVVLAGAVFIAGLMAIILVIYKRRFVQTMRNIGGLVIALLTGRPRDSAVSLDNPEALKVPFGVAMSITVVLYVVVGLVVHIRL